MTRPTPARSNQPEEDGIAQPEQTLSEDEDILTKDTVELLVEYDKDNHGNSNYESEGLIPGHVYAGPGEKRILMKFDVKAFFEENPHIKEIGRYSRATFRISGDALIMKEILKAHGLVELPLNALFCNFSWIGNSIPELYIEQLLEYQQINHFVGSTHLTRKDMLYKNVMRFRKKTKDKNMDFLPISFVLPREWHQFKRFHKRYPCLYIVKPVGLSRGRGVYLIRNPKDIINKNEEIIVSRYINNPLLMGGYKMDLRIYVLVTSFNPLVIYIYQEGLTRFATVQYRRHADNLTVLRMHLTNYSINVSSGNFIRNEDCSIEDYGSKWTLSALLRYFQAKGIDTVRLMSNIEDLIIKTILAAEKPMAAACRIYQHNPSNCFELFGFDIMLDENYKAWLLEVNLSPSLVCSSPLDVKVKSNMLCDLLNLVGVECYQKEKPREGKSIGRSFSQYIHITVGYFCFCLIRDRIRQAFQHRKSNYRTMMRTYKPTRSERTAKRRREQRARLFKRVKTKDQEMLSRVENENSRCGGWVRIFPTCDSWHKYRKMMFYPTTKNLILHKHLYPSRHSDMSSDPFAGGKAESKTSDNAYDQDSSIDDATEELLERVRRYQSGLEIGPPSTFQPRACSRDYSSDEVIVLNEEVKETLLDQINNGHAFTEVQARMAFLKYLTNIKQILKYCERASNIHTYPPAFNIRNLLFQLLGQTSDLIIDEAKPATKYTLDSCLNSFIYHYNRETRRLVEEGNQRWKCSLNQDGQKHSGERRFVSPDLFEEFVHSANPWELENLLLKHLQVHDDASIFMGKRIKNYTPATSAAVAGGGGGDFPDAPTHSKVKVTHEPRPGEQWTTV